MYLPNHHPFKLKFKAYNNQLDEPNVTGGTDTVASMCSNVTRLCKAGTVIMALLQMKKLWHRKNKILGKVTGLGGAYTSTIHNTAYFSLTF